ncbi:MAG TPA: hypothetical protein VGM80_10635 [Gaiellaceae bacterium]|jgi:hypothetical protein
MTAAQIERREAPAEDVFRWRFEQLFYAGYELRDARRLARRRDVDLHQALDLVRTGCPPELAVCILN